MQIVLDIPDELLASLAGPGQDLSRTALEALGLQAYGQRRVTGYQLRDFPGIGSRYDFGPN